MAAATLTAVFGYLGHRYIRVAHCEGPKDDLDEALETVHIKVKEAKQDVKKTIDNKVQELWSLAKDNYISKPAKEAFDFIEKIVGGSKTF